jgi:hypothetical protein
VLTKGNKIFRWRTLLENECKPIELKKEKQLKIKSLFSDAKGYHAIVCEAENIYYLHYRETRLRMLNSLKGFKIEALAFLSPAGTDPSKNDSAF